MEQQSSSLPRCTYCPRHCQVDRIKNEKGLCRAGNKPKVALVSTHWWEEPCISGTKGSGTIFFSHCNLKCLYCQNYRISQEDFGQEISIEELAKLMLKQQSKGVHNINLVSPTQYFAQVKESLILAKEQGLSIPIVYNTNGYECTHNIEELKGLVDIYLPDLKYADNELGVRYSGVKDYFEQATKAILTMYDQVGAPQFDEEGIIKRGIIIRHLVLPGQIGNSKKVLDWLAAHLPKDIPISLMCQYTPMYKAHNHPELSRRLTKREYAKIIDYFFALGLENGYVQELASAKTSYTPDFNLDGVL